MQTDTKYYASCSFGKDSIATILLALEHGEPLDGAIYVEVMFDNSRNISGDNPEAIGWIDEVAIPKLAELGCPTIKLRSEVDYVGYFHKRCTKGKREGKCHGFIYSIGCPLLRDCKLRPMRQFLKGKSVVQYVGIAIDEPQRLEALHKQKGRISLLEKYGYTEKMAMEKCREYGLVSPLYETSNRGGVLVLPQTTYQTTGIVPTEPPRPLARTHCARQFRALRGQSFAEFQIQRHTRRDNRKDG